MKDVKLDHFIPTVCFTTKWRCVAFTEHVKRIMAVFKKKKKNLDQINELVEVELVSNAHPASFKSAVETTD